MKVARPVRRAATGNGPAATRAPRRWSTQHPLPAVDGDPDPMAAATDTRTTGQRNHDALKAGLRALLASGDLGQHRGLPVTAIITMTLEQLEAGSGLALTGGGSTVPMEVAIRMAAHAHHYLYIYDQTCGRPLFLGRSRRLASPDQRIVLHAIDGGCTMPGCDQPAYHCEVGHRDRDWAAGGHTNIDEETLACGKDNRRVKPGGWTTRTRHDGRTEWLPPPNLDTGQARTNNYHHPHRYLIPDEHDTRGNDDDEDDC